MKRVFLSVALLTFLLDTAIYAKDGNTHAAQNPFEGSELARAAGQKLFLRHCAECHGMTAVGTDRAPSLLRFARSAAPSILHEFLRNGNLRNGMPSWSRLPDLQLWQLVTYLQTLEE